MSRPSDDTADRVDELACSPRTAPPSPPFPLFLFSANTLMRGI